jgi:hypothetical protein
LLNSQWKLREDLDHVFLAAAREIGSDARISTQSDFKSAAIISTKSMEAARVDWVDNQLALDPGRLVFIDETWASTNMARRYGRCPRGARLRAAVPHGHWKTTTFVAGLTTRGIIAPFVLDGPINRDAFETYLEKVLTPALRPGRQTPSEIPPHGWKDILLRVFANISSHRILALAAGMTYFSLLAIFPALAALVAVYGLFADPSSIARHLDQITGFLPDGAIDIAREQLTRVASTGAQTLGLTFVAGLGVSLWSANAAMKSLFDTLNIVYGEQEKRGFVKLNAMSLLFTVGGIVFVLAALGTIVVVPVVLNYIGLSDTSDLCASGDGPPCLSS